MPLIPLPWKIHIAKRNWYGTQVILPFFIVDPAWTTSISMVTSRLRGRRDIKSRSNKRNMLELSIFVSSRFYAWLQHILALDHKNWCVRSSVVVFWTIFGARVKLCLTDDFISLDSVTVVFSECWQLVPQHTKYILNTSMRWVVPYSYLGLLYLPTEKKKF